MLKYIAAAVFALVLLGTVQKSYAGDDRVIATVLKVEGTASVVPAGQKDAVPAKAQTQIHMHDILQTAAQSKLFLLFIDNTQITLAPGSKLTVDEYVFDPDNKGDNKARYDILQGTFDYLSGLVAKKPNPDVKVNTPYGAIGIRGTNFWGGNIGQGYGVHVADGQVGVGNGGGNVVVNPGQGTIIPGPGEPPGPPGPWSPDLLNLINSTTGMGGLGPLITGQQGKNKGLVIDFNKHHHHGQQGDNGPNLQQKDLPQDETGQPDVIPFSPGQNGGRFGGD